MDRETATKLAHELARGVSNPPDVDDAITPALETIPDFDAYVRDDASKQLVVLAPPFVFVAELKDVSVTVEALPATEPVAVTMLLTAGGPLLGQGRVLKRSWAFAFGNGRTIDIEGQEWGGELNQEEMFARTLAGALGWSGLRIPEEPS